jgi:hypothetical protein
MELRTQIKEPEINRGEYAEQWWRLDSPDFWWPNRSRGLFKDHLGPQQDGVAIWGLKLTDPTTAPAPSPHPNPTNPSFALRLLAVKPGPAHLRIWPQTTSGEATDYLLTSPFNRTEPKPTYHQAESWTCHFFHCKVWVPFHLRSQLAFQKIHSLSLPPAANHPSTYSNTSLQHNWLSQASQSITSLHISLIFQGGCPHVCHLEPHGALSQVSAYVMPRWNIF